MVTTKMNWSGPNCDFLPKWITVGPDQFILVMTISFWSWPNHYGQVQINLVRPKLFWTDQNCFGHIEGEGINVKTFHIFADLGRFSFSLFKLYNLFLFKIDRLELLMPNQGFFEFSERFWEINFDQKYLKRSCKA